MTATEPKVAVQSPAPVAPTVRASTGPVAYGNSWAEDIQKYHAAKATLPWRPEQQATVKHITRYEKSREEREYNLVLGKFRDAERELSLQASEATSHKKELEKSRADQLRTVQRFNLINHSPMYTGAREPGSGEATQRPQRRTSAVDYNIVTNAPRKHQEEILASSPQSPASKNRRMREFNILTNKYHDRDDQRQQDEQSQAKTTAASKFNTKNKFHPVRIEFYDPEKEKQFLHNRAHEQQTHGQDLVLKLPPRAQFAEGKIYNILTQKVINQSQISRYDATLSSTTSQKQAVEKQIHEKGQQQAERDEQLCLNRFAHERHTQAFVHGFDPITNQPFDGIHAKPRVVTRTHDALPAWEVLERGVPSTTKVSMAGMAAVQATRRSVGGGTGSEGTAAAYSLTDRRANIMVVDHSDRTSASQATQDKAKTTSASQEIRTGGFGQSHLSS